MRCQILGKIVSLNSDNLMKSYNYLQFYEQEVKYIAQSDMTNK